MLTIADLRVNYGRVPALHGVSLKVEPGEVRNDPAVLTAYLGRRVIDVEDR